MQFSIHNNTLTAFLEENGFTSAIPFCYSGHNLSVRIDGQEATIRDNIDYALLYKGDYLSVIAELTILLDKSRRD